MQRRSFSGLVAVWLAAGLSLAAPLAGGAAAGATPTRFRVLAWEGEIKGLNYETGGRVVPVVAASYARSPYYQYNGAAQLAFFTTSPAADGRAGRMPAAVADLTNAGRNPLLIFFPDNVRTGAYRVVIVDDDPANFPLGSARLCNLTGETLKVVLADTPVTLGAGAQTSVKMKPAADSDSVGLSVARNAAGEEETLYTDRWRYYPDLRKLVFIAKVPDGDGFRYSVKWLDEGANAMTAAEPARGGRP